jgi:plasmid stabilization system protein ParE
VSGSYIIRPKADRDLDEQAYYLATEATPDVGHRFLLAAHETFGLLAANPIWDGTPG